MEEGEETVEMKIEKSTLASVDEKPEEPELTIFKLQAGNVCYF